MNVRIFWVRAMKCMCAQTRPRFILSSERVRGGMEFEPMLTPREKSPLAENVPRGGSNPRRCGQQAQALPTELFRPPERLCFFIDEDLTMYKQSWKYMAFIACLALSEETSSCSCTNQSLREQMTKTIIYRGTPHPEQTFHAALLQSAHVAGPFSVFQKHIWLVFHIVVATGYTETFATAGGFHKRSMLGVRLPVLLLR